MTGRRFVGGGQGLLISLRLLPFRRVGRGHDKDRLRAQGAEDRHVVLADWSLSTQTLRFLHFLTFVRKDGIWHGLVSSR